MTIPSALERQLYLSLRAMPCRCEYERNTLGVPLWVVSLTGGIKRTRIKQCSRCAAIEEYEATYGLL